MSEDVHPCLDEVNVGLILLVKCYDLWWSLLTAPERMTVFCLVKRWDLIESSWGVEGGGLLLPYAHGGNCEVAMRSDWRRSLGRRSSQERRCGSVCLQWKPWRLSIVLLAWLESHRVCLGFLYLFSGYIYQIQRWNLTNQRVLLLTWRRRNRVPIEWCALFSMGSFSMCREGSFPQADR